MPKVSHYDSIYFLTYQKQKQQSMLKVAYFSSKIQTWRENDSRILRIENAKSSGYSSYVNTNI